MDSADKLKLVILYVFSQKLYINISRNIMNSMNNISHVFKLDITSSHGV